jgi:hypothetical protein
VTASVSFGYVQARAQARFAGLPRESDWQRLEATRGLSAFLEEARATALKPWVAGLSGASDAHDIDRGIRTVYRGEIAGAGRWVPEDWRAAVHWVQWLPQLLVIGQALAGGRAPAWLTHDPVLAGFVGAGGELDPVALRAAGLGPLVAAAAEGADLPAAWLEAWRSRWPAMRRSFQTSLEQLAATCVAHQRRFLASEPDRTWLLRRELEWRLRHLFHRYLVQPAGLFCYLTLVGVGLERLRGALVGRALFTTEGPR